MGRRSVLSKKDIQLLLKYPFLIPPVIAGPFIFLGIELNFNIFKNLGFIFFGVSSSIIALHYLIRYRVNKQNEHKLLQMKNSQIEYEKARMEKLGRTGLDQVDYMTGLDFEDFLNAKFMLLGYKVTHTSSSGDYGIDLIIEKNNYKIGIQAKRYLNNVPYKAIQEAYSGKRYYGCHEAWVVTTANDFTKQAKSGANKLDIKLFSKNNLADLLDNQSN